MLQNHRSQKRGYDLIRSYVVTLISLTVRSENLSNVPVFKRARRCRPYGGRGDNLLGRALYRIHSKRVETTSVNRGRKPTCVRWGPKNYREFAVSGESLESG